MDLFSNDIRTTQIHRSIYSSGLASRKMLDENSKHTMSSNISKETLLETFRKLLTCDADIKKDFIIESEDRDGDRAKLHVHSSIFTMHPCAQ